MEKWLQKLEVMATAVAFAEAGEWTYAEKQLEKQDGNSSVVPGNWKMPERRIRLRV